VADVLFSPNFQRKEVSKVLQFGMEASSREKYHVETFSSKVMGKK
jgi:hypothetical protein